MAFFKFRWPGQGEQQQAEKPSKRSRTPQAESIEVMRRRARHRLIGAAVLVLVGVIGFPLLFDTQPRPIPVDIPIEIPDRNKVAPLVVPAPVVDAATAKPAAPAAPEQAPAAAAQRPAPSRTAAANGLADGEELVPSARPAAAKPAPAPAAAPARPEVKHEAKPPVAPAPAPAPEPKPVRADDSARARALLEGRSTPAPAAAGAEEARFIVQVGAFADAEKAREARTKVERVGLKTYTQVVDTKDGKRTRVRVGPFTNRAEADKAAARIKALDLSASVLTL
ncbi:SPOR domain-containing protein [Acidovorax sp. Root70]|uniref:SPOR domain-containing protein n=1 Tax=Acidovorax sp. Root70 TaxID=1736590 RepID=UPI0006F5BD9F|nr:SPOR domain-containing protein [Acidovorax sp. Root70]KRB27926.1 sporulation protein [Acidovorax sp. Root70]